MKILMVHRDLPPDSYTGVAIQVHRLANALIDLGHEVTVLTHTKRPDDARYQVEMIQFRGLKLALTVAPFLKRLWYPLWYRKLPVTGFDAIHIHGDGGFLSYRGNHVRTFYGTAALEYLHALTLKGKLAQGFSYWMERRETKRCRLTVGISPHVAGHLPGVDRVIPCMLPLEPDESQYEKTPFPSLIYLGSRNSRKRGEKALDLFQRLRISFPTLSLVYVGPEKEVLELKSQAMFSGIEFQSRLSQKEITDLYRKSWIYLCLSTYEGFGVGIIEAMAASTLVITSPHFGSEYLVRNGDTGIICPIDDTEKTIVGLLSNNEARLEMTRKAREFSRRFSPATVASTYVDLYKVARARTMRSLK